MTEAAFRYFIDYYHLMVYIQMVAQMTFRADPSSLSVSSALRRLLHEAPAKSEIPKLVQTIDEGLKQPTTALVRHTRLLYLEDQLRIARGVDNFLTFISDLLATIYRIRPEALKSSESIKLEVVLSHSSMETLVQELVERRVNQLSYQGVRELSKYIEDRLGLALFSNSKELERAAGIVDARNLIVHNRGIVNRLYQEKHPTSKLGSRLCFSVETIFSDLELLFLTVCNADQRATEKFGLEATRTLSELEEIITGRESVL